MIRNRVIFNEDPFGYSNSAGLQWALLRESVGVSNNQTTETVLKNPVLWLTQAEAMAEAAMLLVKTQPTFEKMPEGIRGICDSQFCAIALMLIGYSLEISLKGILIMKLGVEDFIKQEKQYKHHKLDELASFMELSEKEIIILKTLTHFVYWAGRYPDPGMGKENKIEEIFSFAEKYKITAGDLFTTSYKIMNNVKGMVDSI